jgi:hypothetical protein
VSAPFERTEAVLRLECSPAWTFLDDVRRFAENFCVNCKLDDELQARVAVAVHELLQNGIKYSIDGWSKLELHVKRDGSVGLAVQNRVNGEGIERLKAVVSRMEQFTDPLQHYLTVMKETAQREHGSGLGLARVRYEGRMAVNVGIDGETVTVRASAEAGR